MKLSKYFVGHRGELQPMILRFLKDTHTHTKITTVLDHRFKSHRKK